MRLRGGSRTLLEASATLRKTPGPCEAFLEASKSEHRAQQSSLACYCKAGQMSHGRPYTKKELCWAVSSTSSLSHVRTHKRHRLVLAVISWLGLISISS